MINRSTFQAWLSALLLCVSVNVSASVKNVLFVHSYHAEHTWVKQIYKGFNDYLAGSYPNVNVYHEYMDAKRHPKTEYGTSFLKYLSHKFSQTKLDAIIVSDDPALNAFRSYKNEFIPNVPVVYLGINRVDQSLLSSPNMTGVFESRDLGQAVFDIKAHTGSEELIVITDSTPSGLANLSKIEKVIGDVKAPKNIHIIDQLNANQIRSAFLHFDSNTPVFLIGQIRSSDLKGALLSWQDGTQLLSKKLNNPIYTLGVPTLGYGALGAYQFNAAKHGRQAGEMLNALLKGVPIAQLKPITVVKNEWFFDYSSLKKFKMSADNLPTGSQVVNQGPSFYERNMANIWIFGSLLVFLMVIGRLRYEMVR